MAVIAKQAILVTGVPCVGKTTISRQLAAVLNASYVNLTELAEKEKLILGQDNKRKTMMINETKMRKKLREIIETTGKSTTVIDGHYAPTVAPKTAVAKVFVLRRNPVELKRLMEERGFSEAKLWENLACEILDSSLVEALATQQENKVCELDITGQTVQKVVKHILAILRNRKKCRKGCVDWLGMLEAKGILEEYLRI